MLKRLIKQFKKRYSSEEQRTKIGQLAGILGLISNIILFSGKLIIGLTAGSVSIMADAMNSLSDMISSVLTLVGFKEAAKPADKNHPFGHERFEYISGLAVSFVIITVGLQFLRSSFGKILKPENIHLSTWVFLILILSILIKIWQGKMYGKLSREIKSQTLEATGQDSLNDVFTTVTVLLSAVIEYISGWRIDGFIGFALAVYILYSGARMINDFVYELLGSRPSDKEIGLMEERLENYSSILGYHDLLVHDYGPQKIFASVHIEVNADWNLTYAHQIIDRIEKDFERELKVELVCHLDPIDINNSYYLKVQEQLNQLLKTIDPALKMHDMRIKENMVLQFDLVIPEKMKIDEKKFLAEVKEKIQKEIGDYQLDIQLDYNYLL